MHELDEGLFEIARPALEHDVGVADLPLHRQVLDDRHDPLANDAAEQVVQVLDGSRPRAARLVLDRVACGGHVLPRINQSQ